MAAASNHLRNPWDVTATEIAARESPRIRVCHVSMTLQTGGLERLLVEIGRHCDRSRFDLRFLTLDAIGQPAEDLKELGWRVDSLTTNGPIGKLARLRKLRHFFKTEHIDIVHSHNTLAHFYAALAAKWARVPAVINTQHGRGCGAGWKAKWQFRLANRWTNRIVGVSNDATQLCRNDDHRAAARMQVLWNGIDVSRFEYHGPKLQPVAISVARLAPEKDFGTLLRAVEILIRDEPDFRLKIVGDGPERSRLEQLRRELHLEQHVEFLGERHDVPQLLAQAGFFVLSSRSEGISLTILEAMAVGLPVVTTNVGGNPEIVADGRTGRLVASGSPELLASALSDMLTHRELWPVMGELGRQCVEEHFNVRQMVQQYEGIYGELLK